MSGDEQRRIALLLYTVVAIGVLLALLYLGGAVGLR